MNHYDEIIKELCADMAAVRDSEKMKVIELQLAAVCMVSNGYVFNPHSGTYERG